MDSNILPFALSISGIGIVVLLLVLALLAGVVALMTKYIVDKPEKEDSEEEIEEVQETTASVPEKNTGLEKIAVIALALARAQAETITTQSLAPAGELNSWRQFNLQKRLAKSSTIRRSR